MVFRRKHLEQVQQAPYLEKTQGLLRRHPEVREDSVQSHALQDWTAAANEEHVHPNTQEL